MSATIMTMVNSLPEQLPPDPSREWKISHVGKIDRLTSKILIGIFSAIATVTVALRIVIHLRKRGRLFIDDYLVLFATASLLTETGLLYQLSRMLYIETALSSDPANIALFTRLDILSMMDFLKWNDLYVTFAWTTNYTIKLSFLAFFRLLVKNVSSGLNAYWWFVLCVTVASWLFNSFENFIICGGNHSLKCFPYPLDNLQIGFASTAADFVTDFMIISIPILLIRQSQLRLSQKLRILTFLCLSIFMAGFALARLVGGLYHDYAGVLSFQVTWTHLWLHLESSVAVLMGGVTAFRTVFARQIGDRNRENLERRSSEMTLFERVRRIFGKPSREKSSAASASGKGGYLASVRTGATLRGLRTFIRRHRREQGSTSLDDSFMASGYDPLESYHNFKRHGERSGKSSGEVALVGSANECKMPERPLPVLQTHNIV